MSFFHKKICHKMFGPPFGPVTLIFYWPKIFFSGQPKAGSHFRHCICTTKGDQPDDCIKMKRASDKTSH